MFGISGNNGLVHYSILTNEVPFVIDADNGTIYTSSSLDRESVSSYEIVVQAEDYALHNPLSSTATVSYVFYHI